MTNLDLSEADRTENGPDHMAWQQCKDFETACELTAEWLEGKRHYLPMYTAAQPATETGPISLALAEINRLGFLTTDSQPGDEFKDGHGQRAYVTGYCSDATVGIISAVLAKTPLVAMWAPPGTSGSMQVCVTFDDYAEFTHLGLTGPRDVIADAFGEDSSGAMADIVRATWELHLFDPVWGRNDYLLPSLKVALEAGRQQSS